MSTSLGSGETRIRVLVLFGGRSGEHPVSCVTAGGVLRALDPTRFEAVPVGITSTGRWVPVSGDPADWDIHDGNMPAVRASREEVLLPVDCLSRTLRIVRADGRLEPWRDVDVVLPLLHGPFGEDGTLQGALELVDLPYVGAGVFASAAGMDKDHMKTLFRAAGLPVAEHVRITAEAWHTDAAALTGRVAALGMPVFVKPARAGSSLGISRVTAIEDLPQAVAGAQKYDEKVLVEPAVVGQEVECAVLGGRAGAPPRASLPGQIVVDAAAHSFYDFEAKYLDEASVDLRCPADIPPTLADRVRSMAVRAFEAIDATGLARVDFFCTPDGPVVNEINTMPGFTPFSMYPRMWAETGLPYTELITELIALALERGGRMG